MNGKTTYIDGKKGTFVSIYNTLRWAEMGILDLEITENEDEIYITTHKRAFA